MTAKMPDPVAVVDYDTDKGLFVDILDGELKQGDTLITTGQAEAYADARVREAMEEAASIVQANARSCTNITTRLVLEANARAIVDLISKEES